MYARMSSQCLSVWQQTSSWPSLLPPPPQASFPGNLHLVLVLRPTSFFHRTVTDIGFRFSQEDFMLKMPVRQLPLSYQTCPTSRPGTPQFLYTVQYWLEDSAKARVDFIVKKCFVMLRLYLYIYIFLYMSFCLLCSPDCEHFKKPWCMPVVPTCIFYASLLEQRKLLRLSLLRYIYIYFKKGIVRYDWWIKNKIVKAAVWKNTVFFVMVHLFNYFCTFRWWCWAPSQTCCDTSMRTSWRQSLEAL